MEALKCPVCLDLLQNPVTIPCGHSFCMVCIESYWPEERDTFPCPQCRKRYRDRPALNKNIMLADLVEEGKKAAPPADCYAGPQDVSCDVCSGEKKLKAVKSCLQCLVSYCDTHLQPHHTVAVLQKHQQVAPSDKLQENICKQHNKLMELFCRTDQQLLCLLCSVDQHKGHDTVSSAAERAQRQAELEAKKNLLLQNLQDKEKDLQWLQQETQDISRSAQRAVQRSRSSFRQMVLLLKRRRFEVEQQILSEETKLLSHVKDMQSKLLQEADELKRTISELEKLFNSPDHNQFILHCPSLPTQRKETRIQTGLQWNFEDIQRSVTALTEKLQVVLYRSKLTGPHEDTVLAPTPELREPTTREGMLRFRQMIVVDPNTSNSHLSLSDEDKRIRYVFEPLKYQDHPDRFTYWGQIVSKHGMMDRSYWEVDMSGANWVCVGVTYKDIERKGSAVSCAFGYNKKSWALERYNERSLVEQMKKTAPPADCYAGPQDVSCDVCSGEKKLKATSSSSVSSALWTSTRATTLCPLQLKEPRDRQSWRPIRTCSSRTSRTKRKTFVLEVLEELQQETQDISRSAQTAVQHSRDSFREMALLLKKRRSEVEQQILSEETQLLNQAKEIQTKLQQEANELKRTISELEELSNTPDHNQFIRCCLSIRTQTKTRTQTGHRHYYEQVNRTVSGLWEKLQLTLSEYKLPDPKDFITVVAELFTDIDVEALLSEPQDSPLPVPSTREEFLKYSQNITLDDEANPYYLLRSEENRRVLHSPETGRAGGQEEPAPPEPPGQRERPAVAPTGTQDISRSAQRALQRSRDSFREMVLLLEKRCSEVEQQILSEEKKLLSQVKEIQTKLQQEADELKRTISELEKLFNSPDHNQFILHCPSLPTQRTEVLGFRIQTGHKQYYEKVIKEVLLLWDKLHLPLSEFNCQIPRIMSLSQT
ncbi:hypothetical protein WMY93_023620 [Mugilogobius chulae]|uniref:Tripartite motif-containing protein 16-like n=1 Tax=Mugilogobius chulae TaxID=88201 RepID=A0AAW0N981_9GOBI